MYSQVKAIQNICPEKPRYWLPEIARHRFDKALPGKRSAAHDDHGTLIGGKYDPQTVIGSNGCLIFIKQSSIIILQVYVMKDILTGEEPFVMLLLCQIMLA